MAGTWAEVALVMFVGMGPVKVLVYYLGATRHASPALGRKVAVRAVGSATIVCLGLLVVGWLLMRLLHFSTGALIVAGAYGHTRVRERLFGGVTRHLLEHMTAPTLFGH